MTWRWGAVLVVLWLIGVAGTAWAGPVEPSELPEVGESAYGEDGFDDGQPRARKRLIVDQGVVRPGDVVRVGVLFEMDPGWHIYWRYSGQGGMETEVEVGIGEEIGEIRWPEPTVYHEAGGRIITFGYGGRALLYGEVEVPADAEGEIEVRGEVDYLVCEVDCIPGQASLIRRVEVGEESERAAGEWEWFAYSEGRLPRSGEETGVELQVRYSHTPIGVGEEFRVEISAVGCEETGEPGCVMLGPPPERAADAVVYEGIEAVVLEVARVSAHPEAASGWFVELKGRTTQDQRTDDGELVVVVRARGADGEFLATEGMELFPRNDTEEGRKLSLGGVAGEEGEAPGERPGEEPLPVWLVLVLAFLGGALLNLMPCVFPVLAVKVFSFVQLVQEERQSVLAHSMCYTAGIVGSLMALAAVVIGLQVVGTQVGWGFQFQEPLFIAVVGAVVVVFALNLFGVFEVTLSPGKLQEVVNEPPSHRRSVGEGVLAVVLATPCSAPFLGTAVGFALASSPVMIGLIFFVLGLGLAAPFVVLTLVPGAAKVLPRPGAWMGVFKQFLGFALLGTAIWLLWLMGQMTGIGGATRVMAFLLACAMGVWVFGLTQFRSRRAKWVGLAVAVVMVVGTGFVTLRFEEPVPADGEETSSGGPIAWKVWSEEVVEAELQAGRAVFVDFTADWCITCKVNEANVLEHPSVLEAIEEYDVAMVMADWTRRDERIRLKLAEFGKAGVPMYLMYSPGDPPNPRVLPELLTRDRVISEMREASQ